MAETKVEEKKPTQPWKPASILGVASKYKKPGKSLRWVHERNLDKSLAEGYSIVSISNPANVTTQKTLIDGTPISSAVKVRELVLCEVDDDVVEARKKYFDSINDQSLQSATNEFKANATIDGHGNRAYGEIKVDVSTGNSK